jgi:putative aldouronate transport system permease protein
VNISLSENKKHGNTGKSRKHFFIRLSRDYELYLFLLPAILYYIIFAYGPMYGVQIAFKDFNGSQGIWGSSWVGLKHFKNFFQSYYFWPLIRNTLTVSIYTLVAGFPVPIILALMLNEVKNEKFKSLVQTVTYAPHFISIVVLVGIITIVMSPNYGIVNLGLQALGFEKHNFMTDPKAFRHIYVLSGIWQSTGWNSIIYIAALSSVDPAIHESAVIDGASRLQRIWHINVKSIVPTMVILLILNAGSIMNVGFEKVFLMQNDLNSTTSDVISTYIYRRGMVKADYSFSTAVGLFNNVVNFILLMLVNTVSRKLGETSLF